MGKGGAIMKKSRMQETSIEVTVGAFMFMILLALGFFTIVLSRENVFRKSYAMMVVFKDVRGLREGDNVFVRGVDVGKIKTLSVERDGVRVRADALGRWAYHCHMLLHMELGMFREVRVDA